MAIARDSNVCLGLDLGGGGEKNLIASLSLGLRTSLGINADDVENLISSCYPDVCLFS